MLADREAEAVENFDGEFIKGGYVVEAGAGGSFIVVRGGRGHFETGRHSEMRGFSNHHDMLAWLHRAHRILAGDAPVVVKEADDAE